jgi:alpha-L-fucosidase
MEAGQSLEHSIDRGKLNENKENGSMMSKLGCFIQVILLSALVAGCLAADDFYQPSLDSLARHADAPEWFRDAKLGIYFHWGVYSVPAYDNEWYPRNMYIKNNRAYAHHVETWGDPLKFDYADFVPMFKAERFDPDQWAALFQKAGARFAGPVAEHHDGFAMWASRVTPWNAWDKGPKRDLTGQLEKAIRQQGMRFITTFHHARNNLWEKAPGQWTGHYEYVKKNFPSLLEDPEKAILYGYMPRDQFVSLWKAKLVEVIDKYRPDIIWFDSWLDEIPEQARYEFAAYYFNRARQWNRDVVIVRKQEDLPLEFSVLDHEKSRTSGASERVWMTDDTISTGSWCYTRNLQIKPVEKVIHALVDTVSKNGVVLLNISPMADGTIPDDQQKVLLQLGQWMRINGEGIYDTRPWAVYGEGPTREPEGGFRDHGKFLKLEYSAQDIRYTQSKDHKILYLTTLGWPGEAFTPKSLRVTALPQARIRLLGSDKPVPFEVQADGLVTIRADQADPAPLAYACVFKLEGFEFNSVQ